MSELLIKLFIKNPDDVTHDKTRAAYGILGSVVAIVANVFLFIIKFIIGTLSASLAITADAFNNLSDALSSGVGFIGVKLSEKPADEDHPFGHGRIEYLITLLVAVMVIMVGSSFFTESLDNIRDKNEVVFSWTAIIVLCVSILVKIWLGFFTKKLGKRINSGVLTASGTDALTDVLATAVTLVAMFVYKFTGLCIDGYVGVFVALFIIWAGVGIIKETIKPLIGEPITQELVDSIISHVMSYDGILGTHDLIVHDYGPNKKMASIHAEVSKDRDILESHEVIDRIEHDCFSKLGVFLVIHMDPIENSSPEVIKAKERLDRVLEKENIEYSYHDFRIVKGEERTNVIFDMVIPHKFKKSDEEDLKKKIDNGMKYYDNKYACVIEFDKSFVSTER